MQDPVFYEEGTTAFSELFGEYQARLSVLRYVAARCIMLQRAVLRCKLSSAGNIYVAGVPADCCARAQMSVPSFASLVPTFASGIDVVPDNVTARPRTVVPL
jgi:hypothetical protein